MLLALILTLSPSARLAPDEAPPRTVHQRLLEVDAELAALDGERWPPTRSVLLGLGIGFSAVGLGGVVGMLIAGASDVPVVLFASAIAGIGGFLVGLPLLAWALLSGPSGAELEQRRRVLLDERERLRALEHGPAGVDRAHAAPVLALTF